MNQQSTHQVGFIGLGAMGAHMAKNLAKAGYLSCIWNRTSGTCETLAHELSVTASPSIESLAANVETLLICVSADVDVLEVVNKICQTIRPGSFVIDTSTVSNETAKTAAAMLATKQVVFLDAPVSGGVEGAKNGTLAMMAGGDIKVLEQVRPVLEVLTRHIEHMGPTGYGQATKAVNQIMVAGINQAVTEALAFAQQLHLPMEQVIQVISGGAAGNWFLEHRGQSMTQGTYTPGFKLALHQKDLKICQKMAAAAAIKCDLTDRTISDYQILIEHGYGDEDISALYRKNRSLATE
jgi:3-hydroxyisobutyrate dehydrogenase